jgi:hypothetical protein
MYDLTRSCSREGWDVRLGAPSFAYLRRVGCTISLVRALAKGWEVRPGAPSFAHLRRVGCTISLVRALAKGWDVRQGAPSFAHLRRVGCTISLEGDQATILCLKLPKPSVIPTETQRNGRACLREVEWRSAVCAV